MRREPTPAARDARDAADMLANLTGSRVKNLSKSLTCLLSSVTFVSLTGVTGSLSQAADNAAGEALIIENCGGCHASTVDAGIARIDAVRKTPEGWQMTLDRMQRMHGVDLDSQVFTDVIKYLSDSRGLAPSEAAPWRYVLEVRPDFVDVPPSPDLNIMCGRCHTNARYGLQRRSEDDWLKHMHMHVGMFTSLEYQALGRDREWWKIATTQTPGELAEMFPLESAAWEDWKNANWTSPAGTWRVMGNQPGKGSYQGIMEVSDADDGYYSATYSLTAADGTEIAGSSTAVVYTGFEWRGSGRMNGRDTHEVYAMSVDGSEMTGRWFLEQKSENGGYFRAVRVAGSAPRVLSVSPARIRQGEAEQENAVYEIHGIGLSGDVDLGPGLKWDAESSDSNTYRGRIYSDPAVGAGARAVTVGDASMEAALAVYAQVDYVKVAPEFTIARLGGGTTPPVDAQFEAIGYMVGADGIADTDDDVSLGMMDAQWSVEPFNEEAEKMKDVDYAGTMQPDGRFVPSVAGPNPQRKYSTNNAGNLTIRATVMDGEQVLEGTGHLIVTVQRWVDPPIR